MFFPILLRELIVFKRRLLRKGYFISTFFTPILYFLAFGLGLGKRIEMEEVSYLEFLIPGIIAFSSASESFNWNALSISLSRLYYKTFEEYQTCPISASSLIIGYTLSGCIKGLFSSSMIMAVALFFGYMPPKNLLFYIVLVLNCLVFSCLGMIAGILARSYNDVSILSNFFIVPMTFLCGTFFSLTRFPEWVREFVFYLPLTQTSLALRASFLKKEFPFCSILILSIFFVFFYLLGSLLVRRQS